MTLGQEFGGYAACIARGADDVEHAAEQLQELNLGATAVGTGLNAGEDYATLAVANLGALHGAAAAAGGEPLPRHAEHGRRRSPIPARCGASPWSSPRSRATCGCSASGPRAGIAEIALPAVQPGSSIMPGKVNPSIPEMVNQVCFQVIGCDTTICVAARGRTARAERDDAGHRLERASLVDDPAAVDAAAAHALRRRHRGGRGALPRAAGSQHRGRDGAEPVHRLREDRGDRQGVGQDRQADSRRSCSSAG